MLSPLESIWVRHAARRSFRRHVSLDSQQIFDPDQVVSRHAELEYPSDLLNTSMPQLSQQSNCLEPPKDLFYSLPLLLTDCIARVSGRALVYPRLLASMDILRDMWRHIQLSNLSNEFVSVIELVARKCNSSTATDLAGEHDSFIALGRPSCSSRICIDSKPVTVLHKQMSRVLELCLFSFSLLTQQGIWIGRRFVSAIRAFLSVKVYRGVTWIVRRILIATVSLLKTLKAGRGFNQRPVHREMLIAQQPVVSCLLKHLPEKGIGYLSLQQPLPILGEGRRIPNFVIHAEPHEPPKQHVVVKLLHQHPLASHAVQYLKQQCPQQLFRRDRRPSRVGIQLLKLRRQFHKDLIHHLPNRTKRMVLRYTTFWRDVAEHSVLLKIVTAHLFSSPMLGIEGLLLHTLIPTRGYLLIN